MTLPFSFSSFFPEKILKNKAKKLSSTSKDDLDQTANIILAGGIVAFPFNGIYGLFGDINNPKAAEKIYRAKNRPKDKKLIIVTAPENINEYAAFDHLSFSHKKLIDFWKEIHALGVILPTNKKLPLSLGNDETILTIWTEYEPLRYLFENFRQKGGIAFIGTSANKSGQPTHFEVSTLWQEFSHDVEAIVEADFSNLTDERKKSTTVVDMTAKHPRLHRIGNVNKDELSKLIKKHQLPTLSNEDPLLVVQGRLIS